MDGGASWLQCRSTLVVPDMFAGHDYTSRIRDACSGGPRPDTEAAIDGGRAAGRAHRTHRPDVEPMHDSTREWAARGTMQAAGRKTGRRGRGRR